MISSDCTLLVGGQITAFTSNCIVSKKPFGDN